MTTRAFKSGNSVAVRFPKSFGVAEGTEMVLREEQGRYIVEPVAPKPAMFDVWSFYGSIPSAEPITDRSLDDRPLEIAARGRDGA